MPPVIKAWINQHCHGPIAARSRTPSIITIMPRLCALEHSDCHVGTVEVLMPFPKLGETSVHHHGGMKNEYKPSYQTSNNELGKGEGRRHNDSSDDHDAGPGEDGFPPSEDITNRNSRDGSEEATQGVRSHCDRLYTCPVRLLRCSDKSFGDHVILVGVNLRECFDKGGQGQKTAHDTLVISEK